MTDPPRPQPRPILVPVDFSTHSTAALLWAVEASRAFAAPLVVLHVVHDPAAAPGTYYRSPVERLDEAASEMLDQYLDQLVEAHPTLGELLPIETRLVSGLPANRILETAKNLDARLIVMGSRGRTGLSHLLLGSKAERVAQLSTIPVTIVKDPTGEPST